MNKKKKQKGNNKWKEKRETGRRHDKNESQMKKHSQQLATQVGIACCHITFKILPYLQCVSLSRLGHVARLKHRRRLRWMRWVEISV